ncbi:hypothetical protein [Bacillus sp. MMSF_3328]|uniref:hypothetical protein n=1 Tax=Bacillus TaxID=1386 RepID=UPI00273F180C|nr:hypothetical protein [Bacillus sp. MMSF_3328]
MKKVKYIATMVVEFEVDENDEAKFYPNGLNEESLKEEMESDGIHDIFQGELKRYEIDGYIIEKGQLVSKHKKVFS